MFRTGEGARRLLQHKKMIREIKNNALEIRQEEIQEFTKDEAINVCNRLLNIMSDASNYGITYDKAHAEPNFENSYIADYSEINKFGEEITGRGVFFPNTQFLFKNCDSEVNLLYIVKAVNNYYIIINSSHIFEFDKGIVKHLNYRLYAVQLTDSLYYSNDENKVREYYLKSIIDYNNYITLLNNIKHLEKKDGAEFSNWNKSFRTSLNGSEYAVNIQINSYILSNEPCSVTISFCDRCITLNAKDLSGDFSQKNIYKCFIKEIERKKTEYFHQIAHAKEMINNVRNLVNNYNETQEKIQGLQKTLNNELRHILN